MNLIERIRDYKRLAIVLEVTEDPTTAATLREMRDADSKLKSQKYGKD